MLGDRSVVGHILLVRFMIPSLRCEVFGWMTLTVFRHGQLFVLTTWPYEKVTGEIYTFATFKRGGALGDVDVFGYLL